MIWIEKTCMLIVCEISEEQSLCSQLKDIPKIKICLITYGIYVIVESVADGHVWINEIITSKISKLKKISRITLLMVD